ncbi:hypothetical protein [Sphingosinicella sp. BN140058]|uniref:hypothetical protein n=1 Tax=Sphingosinicella sp. BN140058 TaxID=1892855 RepID=UPI0010116466|nr:hypothetical protein [Sphingosinicella sp. BN140058]QAY76785.1 hypothetical protein ETR14_09965 [Sphingosinicella sp. BN140058]
MMVLRSASPPLLRLAAMAMLAAPPIAVAAASAIHTPAPGSAERIAILKILHDGDDRPEARFRIRQFRVVRTGPRALAYVQGEGEVGAFQALLQQEGRTPWRKVWGEGDGGSNSCEAGARHYAWALDLVRRYEIDPNALFPGLVAQTRKLKRMARAEPDVDCVGDLEGGPGGSL